MKPKSPSDSLTHGLVTICVVIESHMADALRAQARREERSISQVARRLLRQALARKITPRRIG